MISKIEEIAKSYFKEANGCHDWSHVERVRNLALKIAENEGADLEVVEIAALLHDIGRKEEMDKRGEICHAKFGAEESAKIVADFDLSDSQKDNITHSVAAHRSRNNLKPETIEAKCLFDADKIDSLGAIGIGRIFLFAGTHGANKLYTGNETKIAEEANNRKYCYSEEDTAVLEWEVKLKYLKNKVLTKTGAEFAEKRHVFMKNFFDVFWKEIAGEI